MVCNRKGIHIIKGTRLVKDNCVCFVCGNSFYCRSSDHAKTNFQRDYWKQYFSEEVMPYAPAT